MIAGVGLATVYPRRHNGDMGVTFDTIRSIIRAVPFRPIRIFLADQRTIDVRHPEFAAVAPTGRELTVYTPDGRMERLNLLLIVSIAEIDELGRMIPPPDAGQAA